MTAVATEPVPMLTSTAFAADPSAAVEQCSRLEGAMLLVDKAYGITSFVPVYLLRKILSRHTGDKWVKVGHAGTLDPLATGLLILGTRRATRQLTDFLGSEKVYDAELRLGITSPSYDLETQIRVESDLAGLTEADVTTVLQSKVGQHMQLPPIFSAVKQGGKPVYKAARKGKAVTLEAKQVEIFSITDVQLALPYVRFSVHCSKGTYIRSLVHEIGEFLGVGAVLTNLRRTKIGAFDVSEAIHSDELRKLLSAPHA